MQSFEANYYDGISPLAQSVRVIIQDTYLVFDIKEGDRSFTQPNTNQKMMKQQRYLIADCHIQAKLGSGKRLIDLPDDSRLETDFQNLEDYLPKQSSNVFWHALYYAETHRFLIAVSLLAIVLFIALLSSYGVPVIAKYVVMAIPSSLEKEMGQTTLETLDNKSFSYFEATKVPMARQRNIRVALENMCKKTNNCADFSLNFRKSDLIGANAFALPGGFIVITDGLVAIAKSDNEIIAVLAHELGHVKGRHAFRQMLQGTFSGIMIVAITGDFSSITSGLPAFMLNMHYTRDLETEADHYALQSLKTACISTLSYASILLRLEKIMHDVAPAEIISSHLDIKTRILPFIRNQSQCI